MPELPDVTVYVESLAAKLNGAPLQRIRILNPFVLRTALPPIDQAQGRVVEGVQRMGKRIVIALRGSRSGSDEPWYLVIHLMIAGRLRWLAAGAKPPAKGALALLEFDGGTIVFTEAGTQRRASLHLVAGRAALDALDPGGLEVLQTTMPAFSARLRNANHTLKRALTDPHAFSGIGNAYSDEILHRARLSPVALTQSLGDDQIARLFEAARAVLLEFSELLRVEALQNGGWPKLVTAFRPEMAVHGRFGQACPVCGAAVQRIVYASNETNYCARCQTGGRLLADRMLSRLLKSSWPRLIEE
jgi:formamidopyrimidine-DNA glycosylase